MRENIGTLEKLFGRINDLNRKNDFLKMKYGNDAKYARIHKRILENGNITSREFELGELLNGIKIQVDEKILLSERLLDNEPYFKSMVLQMVKSSFEKNGIAFGPESVKYVNDCVTKEYLNQFQGI
jgi:type I restriction enzyme R subunit